MDFAPDDELKILRQAIREFAEDAVAPLVKGMEEDNELPAALIDALAAQGLYGISVPMEYGGTAMTALERLVMLEEVARVSATAAAWVAVQHSAAAALQAAGSARQKEEVLPALAGGRAFAALALGPFPARPPVTLRNVSGGIFRLDGQVAWCPGAPRADWFIVETASPAPGRAVFLLPRSQDGLATGPPVAAAGLRGLPAGPLLLDGVGALPDSRLEFDDDGVAAAQAVGFCGITLGIAQAALDAAMDFSCKRVLYGKPIAGLQAVQFRVAEMFGDLEAGRVLAYRAAWLLDQGTAAALDLYAAWRFLAAATLRGTRKAVETFGGYGCLKDFPVERYMRDAMTLATEPCPVRAEIPENGPPED